MCGWMAGRLIRGRRKLSQALKLPFIDFNIDTCPVDNPELSHALR